MRGSHILFHPALFSNLNGVVLVAVIVFNLGGTANEIGVIHIIHIILQVTHLILQTVNLMLQTRDVRNSRTHNVDRLVLTLVSGEGAYSLAILLDGECGVVHCRNSGLVDEVVVIARSGNGFEIRFVQNHLCTTGGIPVSR